MNVSIVQNNNTSFCCLNKPCRKLTQSEIRAIWYKDFVLQQPIRKTPSILIAHAKQLFKGSFDDISAMKDIDKPFIKLLLNK